MSTRPLQILQRLPAHLEAARPDKQLWSVVEALAEDLDLLSTDLAGVRRAHRLKDVDTLRDLLLLAGLHGMDRLPAILFVRAARVRALAKQLAAAVEAHDTSTRDARAESLFSLWGTAAAAPRLPLYAPPHPPEQPADLDAAATALAAAARASVSTRRLLDSGRVRLAEICEIHSRGNATVRAMLLAAANALDLDVDAERNAEALEAVRESPNEGLDLARTDGFLHSKDRFLHLTHVRDRLQPPPRQLPPATPDGPPVSQALPYQPELIGLEENPVDPMVRQGADGPGKVGPVVHKQLFNVPRRGFANERLRIDIKGMNGRTTKLQFVHRDEGKAICFAGTVPDGKTLQVDEDGNLTLDGANVNKMGFSWRGGCFGDHTQPNPRDWRFAGPPEDPAPAGVSTAVFAVSTPPGALDAGATFPHPEVAWGGLGIAIGLNRFAFFVENVPEAPPDQKVADIILSWLERTPYLFKIWIPRRFQALDTPGDLTILQRLELALERFRPMGVQAQAVYQDDAWLDAVEMLLEPAT